MVAVVVVKMMLNMVAKLSRDVGRVKLVDHKSGSTLAVVGQLRAALKVRSALLRSDGQVGEFCHKL